MRRSATQAGLYNPHVCVQRSAQRLKIDRRLDRREACSWTEQRRTQIRRLYGVELRRDMMHIAKLVRQKVLVRQTRQRRTPLLFKHFTSDTEVISSYMKLHENV